MNQQFRVGSWLVRPSLNTISQNGTSNRLEPKVMEVLVCLAEHTGEVVPKEKLLQTVWPDTFVSDDVLKRSIFELRHVFEDDARESKIIETIPKRGYRLIAAIEPVDAHVSADGPIAHPADPQRAPHRREFVWLAFAGSLLVCGLLVALNVANVRGRIFGSRPPIGSLAVLPLQNLSGDPSQDYFADGMTEELITELSRLSSLRVISRTSVMRYKKSDKSLPEIAREIGVEGIIEGSVLRSGNRVRITAQLIYAPQDKNIWAQSYERDLEDVLALQSTVASNIADEIRVKMTPGEQSHLHTFRPVNLKAHESYLQGRYHVQLAQDALFKRDKGKLNAVEAEKAEKHFRQAIREDPNYAPPYFGVWEAWETGPLPPRDWAPRLRPMLLKALQLDDSFAEAHRSLGQILRQYDWDWSGAEKEFRRALQLAPSDADAHSDYGDFLASTGRLNEAVQQYELAQSLDPKNDRMACVFYWTRQFDRAIELLQSQAQSRPSDFGPHMQLASIYALTGRHQDAISEWQKMGTILEYKEMSDAIARAYKAEGYEKALRIFTRQLEASSQKAYIPAWFIALIYAYAGDNDKAFAWLEKAYQDRDCADSLNDPQWDPLRSDPRFADLMRRVGLAK